MGKTVGAASDGAIRVLSFVNHVAPRDGIEAAIEQAFEWGVDVIVAQGTGTDWGAYWLGSGRQVDTENFKANVRPYLKAAHHHGVPFVFSVGIAGADPHVAECLGRLEELCVEEGLVLDLGVIDTEIDKSFLLDAIDEGRVIRSAYEVPSLVPELTAREVEEATRIVGLVGPEPIADLLATGAYDGVVTGRAVDIALYIAPMLLHGIPKGIAAHAAKILECGGLALEPGDPGRCIWARVDADGFEVRSPDPAARPTVKGMASHAFYERSNPFREENPGGYLDLSDVDYEQGDGVVRCTGAAWVDAPYTLLIEGAHFEGFRSIVVMGVREPALLDQLDSWIASAKASIDQAERYAHLKEGVDYHLNVRVFGRDAVLGPIEPTPFVTGHEVGVVLDVVAADQALADQIAYYAFIRLYVGPYEGRKTTAGNLATPFMPLVIPVGELYSFSIYHVLPVQSPAEPFRTRELRLGSAR